MEKSKKMGRPPKDPEKVVSETFRFRVKPGDAKLIRRAADQSSSLTLSDWIRDRVIRTAKRETR